MEIKLTQKLKTKKGEPKSVVKRGSTKFSELVLARAYGGKSPSSWVFEHHGREVSDMDKTLVQVSGSPTHGKRWVPHFELGFGSRYHGDT